MSHLGTTRRPMSEARRQQVHGPLIPADAPEAATAGDWWLAAGMLAMTLGVVGYIIGAM